MNFNEPAHQDRPVGERAARRRRQRSSSGPSRSFAAIVTVLALVVLAVAGWAIWPRDGQRSAAAAASTTSSSATDSAGSSNPGGSTKASSSSSAVGVAPAAFTACRAEVARGDALDAASASVADHWEGHTSSLTRLQAGQISQAQADATWKRTKLAGPSDMKRYQAAVTAYGQSKGACARMGALPRAWADAGAQCAKRANANSGVAAKVVPVSAAWASHLTSMKAKAETPVGRYMAKWHQQVASAPKILASYRAAASAVRASPTCPSA